MHLFLSGEGSSDLGVERPYPPKKGRKKQTNMALTEGLGPVGCLLCQLLHKNNIKYSKISFVAKKLLKKSSGKTMRGGIRSGDRGENTGQFYSAAKALIEHATEQSPNQPFIAVLFRDADETHSKKNLWQKRWDSIEKGFRVAQENLQANNLQANGIPMVARPRSEAWFLCALKHDYCNGERLEEPCDSKAQKDELDEFASTLELIEKIQDNEIDATRIDMPSLNATKDWIKALSQKIRRLEEPK